MRDGRRAKTGILEESRSAKRLLVPQPCLESRKVVACDGRLLNGKKSREGAQILLARVNHKPACFKKAIGQLLRLGATGDRIAAHKQKMAIRNFIRDT